MNHLIGLLLPAAVALLLCAGCGSAPAQTAAAQETPAPAVMPVETGPEETAGGTGELSAAKELKLFIGDTEVSADWEDNASVEALIALVKSGPLSVPMSMYGGFEQVGPLGTDLPRDDKQTETGPGDIVLYSGDQIVIFYGANSWAYTRLGRIADRSASELAGLLGNGDVTVILAWE